MRFTYTVFLGLAVLIPGVCRAQSKCPWFSEPTARGVLNGPVSVTVNLKGPGDGDCVFTRQEGSIRHQLDILVITMTDIPKQFASYSGQCTSKGTPLRAIGNEAVLCSIQTHMNTYAEKVVGRVREKAFIVTISSSVQDDSSFTQQMRREKVQLVAEQIAGILF
jgi:hypothetical protein